MKLVVQELGASGINQRMTPFKNTIVTAIRLHLYRHNFASGSLKVEIYNDADHLLATSESVQIDEIRDAAFFHGFVTFNIHVYLKKDELYRIQLVGADGYTFDEDTYCGWVNSRNLATYPMTSEPSNDYRFPYNLQIWERTEK